MAAAARQADPEATEIVSRVEDLSGDAHLESETVRALRGVSEEVAWGEWIAVMGPSGSEKSAPPSHRWMPTNIPIP